MSLKLPKTCEATEPYREVLHGVGADGFLLSSDQKRPFVHNSVRSQFLEGL